MRYLGLTPEWAKTICCKAVEGCSGTRDRDRFDSTCSRDYSANLKCNYRNKGTK